MTCKNVRLGCLCGAHHRAVHEGALRIGRLADQSLVFFHADGTLYGAPPAAPIVLLQAKAFRSVRLASGSGTHDEHWSKR